MSKENLDHRLKDPTLVIEGALVNAKDLRNLIDDWIVPKLIDDWLEQSAIADPPPNEDNGEQS